MFSSRIPYLLFLILCFSCTAKKDKLFDSLSPNRTGVRFKNIVKETEQFHVLEYGYFYNGGGVAIGDVNNDDLPDLYFTGNLVASHLYLNKGDFKFEEVAENAGVSAAGLWNTGVTMADVNGDGWLDIYVCRSAAAAASRRKNLLFINNGDAQSRNGIPTFSEKAEEYGLADPGYTTQAAFFDYDRDGDLDMYLLNHSVQEYAGFSRLLPSYKTKTNPAYGDKLYRNESPPRGGGEGPLPASPEGGGAKTVFTDVTEEAGIITNVLGFGLGVAVEDLNGDGWLDVYVSNDYNEEDYLYINQQDGTFKESLDEYIDHVSLFSMGSDIADYNNDGLPDILTLDMLPEDNYRQKLTSGPDHYDKYHQLLNAGFHPQTMRNMLQLNNGDGSFSEIGQLAGVSNTDWSWAGLFADFDNDGWKDLFVSNGYEADYTNMDFLTYTANEKIKADNQNREVAVAELLGMIPSVKIPNYIYQNQGDLTFRKVITEWGLDQPLLSNGAAYADLDNDGDLDLITNNINDFASVYRNMAETLKAQHHYLRVALRGKDMNTYGIGSRVCLYVDDQQYCQLLMPTRGFQSSVEPLLTFGLGDHTMIDRITVEWADGGIQQLSNVQVDQRIAIEQNSETTEQLTGENAPAASPLFTSIPRVNDIDYRHRENDYVDFKREVLLPNMLSTLGPRMACGDVNNDGLEDVFFGGAKGSPGRLYLQKATGGFELSQQPALEDQAGSEDTDALFFDADGDGDLDLYVVSGGNEFAADAPELQDRLYLNDGKGRLGTATHRLPRMLVSGGCVSAGDYDRDGDMDLFVGGRLTPGNYPVAPQSFLLENDGQGQFSNITETAAPQLERSGMVTDASWTDFDDDGKLDLLLVGEWMPVTFFHHEDGKLVKAEVGIMQNGQFQPPELTSGWWNRLAAADFDGDGDTDYVLANYGWNSQMTASPAEPATLYARDFDHNGSIDPVLTYYIQGMDYPAFSKDDMEAQLRHLKRRFVKYEDYARATIRDLFDAEELNSAEKFHAYTFSSSYLENKGQGQFDLRPLPAIVQFAPMYGIVAEDFNGDGRLDILMGGNLTATRVKFGQFDAGKGALLLGDGNGRFTPSDNADTGLLISGEVRDMAVITIAGGQRLLVIAKNDGPVQLEQLLKTPLQ